MNPTGTVMAAAAIPGTVYLSTDSGANFAPTSLPTANWISVKATPTGSKLVAVAFEGAMYISNDAGLTWNVADAAFNPTGNTGYESVAMSSNGNTIVSVEMNGPIRRSTNGGTTFAAIAGTTDAWRAVDMTPDGNVVVAASQNGSLRISTNGGAAFTPLNVRLTADGPIINDGWYRLKISDDGNTIAVVGNPDYAGTSSGIYVSRDRGVTWTQPVATSASYTSVSMSANGDIIGVTSSGATGQVLLSTNGGVSFAPITVPAGETNWRNMAITSNASRALLAAGTFFGATGGLYTSSGSLTGQ